jgi:nicotinamidase-related amidase
MSSPLLAHADLSQLVLVDIQTKLLAVMQADEMRYVLNNSIRLAKASDLLNVPVIITEQYPSKLGNTEPSLLQSATPVKPIEKITFSCVATPAFFQQLISEKSQIILAGLEAHICVLQTAIDLMHAGKQVFVVEDAIISRNPQNKANAIARLREAGCMIANTESILFEWLGAAQGDAFKAISKLVK